MRKSRFTEEQIAYALRQTEMGISINKVCAMFCVSERTFYRWKSRYKGMVPSDINRLKKLEAENAKLKKRVVDLNLDVATLQDLLSKGWTGLAAGTKHGR